MRFLARLFLSLFIVSSLLFIVTASTHAEGEFKTDYDVAYTIDTTGKTSVAQNITLTNKTANYYADKFELKIGSTKVENVSASDETGGLQTSVKFENNVTTISVKFSQKVIGIDKSLKWNLNYASNELATKSGQIWEISIPKVSQSPDIGSYNATVKVPRSFGPAAFTLPDPKTKTQSPSSQDFTFDKNQLTKSGISMSFGEKQVFAFKLDYYLANNNVTSQLETITLPPDNNYQKVVLSKIEPPPQDVSVDGDGNFIAKYKLPAKSDLEIRAEGYVEVFSKPFRNIYGPLTIGEKSTYTQPQSYWETDNGEIKNKANELKSPEQIYEFVTNYLTYNQDRLDDENLERKGAASAYTNPTDAVCTEFTDLFIAIARAAGIPAREVEGYAYTQNERLRPLSLAITEGDVLHAWPEYWDDKLGWVQIDPTWGSTSGGLDYLNKLDFNHVTFTQRGLSSIKPYPAGSYKRESNKNTKSVNVSFADVLPDTTTSAALQIDAPDETASGFPLNVKVSVTNNGPTSIIGQKLTLSAPNFKFTSDQEIQIPILPPFATKTFEFRILTDDLLREYKTTIIAAFGTAQTTKPITVEPVYKIFMYPIFILSLAATALIVWAGLHLYKKVHLHRTKL